MVGSAGGWHLLPLHLRAVQSDSPYHACRPHHLNRCVLPEQPHLGYSALPPHPRSSVCRAGAAWSQPLLYRKEQKSARCAAGNYLLCSNIVSHRLLLNYLFYTVKGYFSITHPPPPSMITPLGLASQPRGFYSPHRTKPSERVRLQSLVEACSFFSAPVHWFARSPYRGAISSIPWCLFSSTRAGNDANYCITSCSLKGICNEADRIGLNVA